MSVHEISHGGVKHRCLAFTLTNLEAISEYIANQSLWSCLYCSKNCAIEIGSGNYPTELSCFCDVVLGTGILITLVGVKKQPKWVISNCFDLSSIVSIFYTYSVRTPLSNLFGCIHKYIVISTEICNPYLLYQVWTCIGYVATRLQHFRIKLALHAEKL